MEGVPLFLGDYFRAWLLMEVVKSISDLKCTSMSVSRSMIALSWNFGLMAKGNPNLGEMST